MLCCLLPLENALHTQWAATYIIIMDGALRAYSRSPSRSPTWVAESSAIGPPSAAFSGTVLGRWSRSKAASTQTDVSVHNAGVAAGGLSH